MHGQGNSLMYHRQVSICLSVSFHASHASDFKTISTRSVFIKIINNIGTKSTILTKTLQTKQYVKNKTKYQYITIYTRAFLCLKNL